MRSPALSVLLILLLAMPLAGSDRSQLSVRLTLRPCRKEWLAVIRPPDWLHHSNEESALLQEGQDKVGFALDVAFSFVRKSLSQSLLQLGIHRGFGWMGPKIVSYCNVMMTTGILFPDIEPPTIRKITAPVLLLSGAQSYPFLGLITEELARLLANCESIVLPHAGHQMWYQDPDACRKDVEVFLVRIGIQSTKAKVRNVMHGIFAHACRHEWLQKNPISLVRQGAKREKAPDVLDAEELRKLLAELQNPARVLSDRRRGIESVRGAWTEVV